MAHWKHDATRCAVEGCARTRVKGWSTCSAFTHQPLGKFLAGAGRIEPIPAPAEHIPFTGTDDATLSAYAAGGNADAQREVERRATERGIGGAL